MGDLLVSGRGWALGTLVPSCETFHSVSRGRLACLFGNPRGPTEEELVHTRESREPCTRDAVSMAAAISLDEDRDVHQGHTLGKSSRAIISPKQGRLASSGARLMQSRSLVFPPKCATAGSSDLFCRAREAYHGSDHAWLALLLLAALHLSTDVLSQVVSVR